MIDPPGDGPPAGPRRSVVAPEPGFLVGVGLLLRLPALGESLSLDELFTAWVAAVPWTEMAERAGVGNAHPAFYALVRGSVGLFGPTEWAVRLPALVFGTLVPVAVF